MDIVYSCGYHSTLRVKGKVSGNSYLFRKRFVTQVDNEEDAKFFLGMTAKDIQWCPKTDKRYSPFLTLEDFCANKEGRYDTRASRGMTYDPKEYKKLFSLKSA